MAAMCFADSLVAKTKVFFLKQYYNPENHSYGFADFTKNVWRHCIACQQNEEKRRHCNANWKPTRENKAKLQIYDLIMTLSLSHDVIITVMTSQGSLDPLLTYITQM